MKKIILICSDEEKNNELKTIMKQLFPDCSIEVIEKRKFVKARENYRSFKRKGDNIDVEHFC